MRSPAFHLAAAFAAFVALASAHETVETWTDVQGRSFEARLHEVKDGQAIFSLPGGRRFATPLDHLAADSRARVRLAPATSGAPPNFRRPWPREVRQRGASDVRVIAEDARAGRFEYESPNYRYLCDSRLSDAVLRNFSVMFETTLAYCRELPLGLAPPPPEGKWLILLFTDYRSYVRAGGMPGSAGLYDGRRQLVMVPLESLGVRPIAGGFTIDHAQENTILIHELTHQLTPAAYFREGARGWFSEGLAEYVANSPYSWGYFQSDPHGRAAKAFVTGFGLKAKGGRNLGTTFAAPSLERFLTMSYAEFVGPQAMLHYGFGYLLTHYFFHMDGRGDAAAITTFLEALRAGKPRETALEALLAGRTFPELERQVAAAWKAKGVTIEFR